MRACQCSFCTRHGAKTVSDPAGRCRFEIDGAALSWYLFETRTGMSLICNRCGMYAGVMIEDGDNVWSVLNARGLAISEFRDRAAEPRDYEGETPEAAHRPAQGRLDADGDRVARGKTRKGSDPSRKSRRLGRAQRDPTP